MRILKFTAPVTATLLFLAGPLLAASDDSSPPAPTQTTKECTKGKVWDQKTKQCVTPGRSGLDAETLYQAARELAYADQLDHALAVLDAMPNQRDDRVLTYRGFVHRKLGDRESAYRWYRAALDRNPDNLLARSYMGQGLIADGDLLGARIQLREIRARGGGGTWPERALLETIETGAGTSY